MTTFDRIVLPLAAVLVAAVVGFVADRAARARRQPKGDRGDFWARIVQRVCVLLALPVLISGVLAIWPAFWQTGRHLHFDLTGVFGWSIASCYRLALSLPFVAWILLLVFGLIERPGGREAGRWFAGALFGDSRLWVLVWAGLLALILGTTMPNLGGGPGAYPAVAWGTLAVLLLSIVGVALSRGRAVWMVHERVVAATTVKHLRPWPEALEAHGVKLRHVVTWPASSRARPVRHAAAMGVQERLRLRDASGIAPELVEAIDSLLSANDPKNSRSRLILAPDDCGQAEVVALAAELLEQRFRSAALVVTAGDAGMLADEIARWLPGEGRVAVVKSTGDIDAEALVVVTDAQVLSDRLLPQLKNPRLLQRFGLVVWWHLEAFTGVLAANLWAISRRLHRLFEATGRHDVLTLAFVRNTPHGAAQLTSFVRRLLPHPMSDKDEVHIEPRFPRTVHLHVLESHQDYFGRGEGRNVQGRHRHLPLVATKVSIEEGWSTRLDLPADVTSSEAAAFLQLPVGDEVLRDQLQPDSATAAARVRKLEAGETLSLIEILGHGGRSVDEVLPHHVGMTLPYNPYVAYLLSTLGHRDGNIGFSTSRRLVSAVAPASVVRRHLLLALDELPDTRSGLLKNFLWNEKVIRKTLEEIANEGKLTRAEVRFLDDRNELRREHEYKSQRPPAGERRPLDTVGTYLIDVRDPSAGFEAEEGVKMRVDPERLIIQAYPHRVFLHGGQRYRIREWNSIERAQHDGWIACDREDVYGTTWRIRNASVFNVESSEVPVGVGRKNKLLTCLGVSLTYEEEVVGALRQVPDLTTGVEPRPETLRIARPIAQSFPTRALVLRFPDEPEPLALSSLAQALRYMFPVHLGVEEDAVELVPLTGELVQERAAFGLAIVDLYPGGIGVVDAIADDSSFLLQLLEGARDWLAACVCQNDQGCARCLRSASALAANSHQPPMRSAALSLLRQVV